MDNKENKKMGRQLNMEELEQVTGGGMRTEESHQIPEEDEWYNEDGNKWIWID